MPDLQLTAEQYSTPETALTPGQVWTVTFPNDAITVEVVSDGAAKIRWTCDGSTPTEDHGWFMPAMLSVDMRTPAPSRKTVVKVWSPGAPTIVVQLGRP